MRGRWWVGATAGVALGIGAVVGVEAATDQASAQRPIAVTAQQLKINQKISTAAVKRSNLNRQRLNKVGLQLPLWAVSTGAAGSNLLRGDGVISSQRLTDGNYRVRFIRNISACAWAATTATEGASLPDGFSVRVALDTTEASRSQLIVRTNAANGTPADSGFHVLVFC
jgi:hypothetical protein